MGRYTTRAITPEEFEKLVQVIRSGYRLNGRHHFPDTETAAALVIQANIGCRIGDVLNLKESSFIRDGDLWKIDIREEKTGKRRSFIIPENVIEYIRKYHSEHPTGTERIFKKGKSGTERSIHSACEFLGYKNVASHSVRKMTACRIYDASGHDIQTVSQWLQHSNVKTTMRYIKRSDAQIENAISSVTIIV